MNSLEKAAKVIVESCAQVKKGESFLIVVDEEAYPFKMGKLMRDAANAIGADPVIAIMNPRKIAGHEPPQPIAAAMRSSNAIICVTNRHNIGHTTARTEATAAGARFYVLTETSEDYFNREISDSDIEQLKDRANSVADKLTKAQQARITTPAGTDVTMSLKGRDGMGLHPQWPVIGVVPDYAEAAIAPLEGTTDGIFVIDIGCVGWGYMLKSPIRCTIKAGKVVEINGNDSADVEKLRRIAATDENSSNIAEFGIGLSDFIPMPIRGTRRDAGRLGTAHLAIGRSNDIGGQVWSQIHVDLLMNRPTIVLDGVVIIKDGSLL